MLNTTFDIKRNSAGNLHVQGFLFEDGEKIGDCHMSAEGGTWDISAWFIEKDYQNKGYGSYLLAKTIEKFVEIADHPDKIRYLWNGQNGYVKEWLDRFDATMEKSFPVAVMKYEDIYPDDFPEAHIFVLNKDKFLKYCEQIAKEDVSQKDPLFSIIPNIGR